VSWEEVEEGIEISDFTLRNAAERIRERGDPWKPLLHQRGRFDLSNHL
jgi:DNA primase